MSCPQNLDAELHDHKSKRNNGKKNKYYQPGHHDAIITRAQWNAAQRILNSHRFGHAGGYLPMAVIDHGALTGFISINRSWAGYEADEYYRICSIAMGMEEGELEADLENEHLPDGGRRIAGLTDDNGVQRIARQLSQVEEAVKAQLEGKPVETQEEKKRVPVEDSRWSAPICSPMRLTGCPLQQKSDGLQFHLHQPVEPDSPKRKRPSLEPYPVC